jgi:predicted extracellular nuclease
LRSRSLSLVVAAGLLATSMALPTAAGAATPSTTGLVISEYVEGSSFNKAIELYNGTGAPVPLTGLQFRLYSNGRTLAEGATSSYDFPDQMLAEGDVFVVTHPSFNDDEGFTLGGNVDATSGAINFNGNDAFTIVDTSTDTVIDSFGQVGDDTSFAANVTLRRTEFTQDTTPDDPFSLDGFSSHPSNTVDDLGLAPGSGGGDPDPEPEPECGTTDLTTIQAVQGRWAPGDVEDPADDASTPLFGDTVTIRGVVTLADDDLSGFFVQDPIGDDDPYTSDGVFVFWRGDLPVEGETVEVTGEAREFFDNTQVSADTVVTCDEDLVAIAPTDLVLPADDLTRENLEGMLVTNSQTLYVTGLYTAYANGELGLSIDGPLTQPTSEYAPGTPEADALAELNAQSLVYVNDRDEAFSRFNDYPWELFDEDLSAGDTFDPGTVVGVVRYTFGDHLIEPLDNEIGDPSDRIFFPESDDTSPIPAVPTLADGNDFVAFNVLNYFDDFGDSDALRGARSAQQFELQTAKIVDAILEMDAAVYGLVEIENDYGDFYDDDSSTIPAIVHLVEALNAEAGAGTFAYIQPDEELLVAKEVEITQDDLDAGAATRGLGTDAIAQGIVYQPAKAEPVGGAATFDIDALLVGDTENSRAPLAQTFKVDKEFVEVVVNHFKSKGSSCTDTAGPGFDFGDDVETALTGNCNLTREYAAERLVEWVENGATGFPTDDVLLLGDFNSYEEEGPIEILVAAGFVDLVERDGDDAFTYKFDGRYGRLDYAFASPSLAANATDTEVWQINSRAPYGYLYYNDPQTEDYPLFWASSDHDPVVVSIATDGVNGTDGKGRSGKRG